MQDEPSSTSVRTYTGAIRATSSVQIEDDKPLVVHGITGNYGKIDLVFRTRYIQRGFRAPIPGDLWIEATGSAASIKEAANAFANAALSFFHILVISANAPIDSPEVHLVFEIEANSEEHEYFQNLLSDEPPVPKRQQRKLDVGATIGLIEAISIHPNSEALHRAMNHYALALENWRFGQELLAVEFLYMAAEALTEVAVDEHRRRQGVDQEQLARSLGILQRRVTSDECPRCARRRREQWEYEFKSAVRRELIFGGDATCYRAARKVSNGFEHGYDSFAQARNLARTVVEQTARYVRRAILDLVGVRADVMKALTAQVFDTPLGGWPITSYIFGTLTGPASALAAENEQYPYLRCETSVVDVWRDDDGKTKLRFDRKLTAVIGESVQFQPHSQELWEPGPSSLTHDEPTPIPDPNESSETQSV